MASVAEIGSAKFGDDAGDAGLGFDGLFDLVADRNGLGKGYARETFRSDYHGAFVKRRHELSADELQRAKRDDDEHDGRRSG